MRLETYHWEKVTVKYDSPVDVWDGRRKIEIQEEELKNVRITFRPLSETGVHTLQLIWADGKKDMLLTRAVCEKLTPWSAEFTAYWYSGTVGKPETDKLVLARVTCEF